MGGGGVPGLSYQIAVSLPEQNQSDPPLKVSVQ